MTLPIEAMPSIKIQSIPVSHVREHDKVLYNTNNIWTDGKPPADYYERNAQTNSKHWLPKFHPNHITVTITKNDLRWIREAFSYGVITGRFPHMFDDELDDLVRRYEDTTIFNGTEYFVRTEEVSLKEGCHGAGPYTNIRAIVQSLVTCRKGHTAIKPETTEIKLYLLPWIQIPYYQEFRVFVHDRKITAISQQHLYDPNKVLYVLGVNERDKLIHTWITSLQSYFRSDIVEKIDIASFVMDIAILENGLPYFIEINTFGTKYASGSSLFGWTQDEAILYGDGSTVVFRWTTA